MAYLTVDEFKQTISELSSLRDAGRAWLVVSSGGANFIFSRAADANPDLRRASDEIEEAIQAAIDDDSPDEYAERRDTPLMRLLSQTEDTEPVETAGAKLEAIRSSFDIDELRRRQWTKRLSKTALPSTIDWEVGLKYEDDSGPIPGGSPVPFGVLRVAAHLRGSPPGPHQHPDLVLTVDTEDVAFIVGTLLEFKTELEAMETRLEP